MSEEALVRELLALAGLAPSDEEVARLAAAYPMIRELAAAVHAADERSTA